MFVGDEVQLEVSFAVARDRLRQLAEAGALLGTSEDAYDHGTTGLERVGAPGFSKLVRVQVRELAWTDQSVGLAIRWEATGPGGGLFPVLDADLTMAPIGERATILTLAGAYRPPLGTMGAALDRAILHHVASATISAFLAQAARRITGPAKGSGPGAQERRCSACTRALLLTGGRSALSARYFCSAGSGCDWLADPLVVCRFQSRQMSRCTGIHLGMSRRPGMNGMHSSSMVAAPVM